MKLSFPRTAAIFRLLAVVPLIALAVPAQTEQSSFAELNAKGLAALHRHSLREAEDLFGIALSRLPESASNARLVLSNELGQVHQEEGRFAEAQDDYLTALKLAERLKPPEEGLRAVSVNNLGSLANARAQFPEAERRFREAIDILDRAHSTDLAARITALSNLGLALQHEHEYNLAEKTYREAMELAQGGGLTNDLSYAKLLVNFGMLRFQTGDYGDAVAKYRPALQIGTSQADIGPIDKAVLMHNLGVALFQTNALPEAEVRLKAALELYESDPAGPNLKIIETLTSLSLVQGRLGKLQDAQNSAERALHLATKLTPQDSAVLANVHNTSGSIEKLCRNTKLAKAEFETALKLSEQSTGTESPEHSAALSNLAGLAAESGHHRRAAELYRQALSIDEGNFGAAHPRVAADLGNLGAQLFAVKQMAEALDSYERARALQEKTYGTTSVEVARSSRSVAVVLQQSRRFEEAQNAYERALAAFKVSLPETAEYASCLRDYAVILRLQEHYAEAEEADLLATNLQVKSAIRAGEKSSSVSGASSFR